MDKEKEKKKKKKKPPQAVRMLHINTDNSSREYNLLFIIIDNLLKIEPLER